MTPDSGRFLVTVDNDSIDLRDLLTERNPQPVGICVDGPLVTVTGEQNRLIIQIGQTESGRLVPTGFIVGCESPPKRVSRSVVEQFSFPEILYVLDQLAVQSLSKEAPKVGRNPGRRGRSDDHYRQVAEAYNGWNSNLPLRFLAQQWRVTPRTLHRWLKRARQLGYLI